MAMESNNGLGGSATANPESQAGAFSRPDYEVGYGKPPKEHRFPKGRSGNPKGRKRGRQIDDVRIVVEEVLAESVKLREGGKARNVSKLEAMLQAELVNALKGDRKAAMALFKLAKKTGMFSQAKPAPCLAIDPPGTDEQRMILRAFHAEQGTPDPAPSNPSRDQTPRA